MNKLLSKYLFQPNIRHDLSLASKEEFWHFVQNTTGAQLNYLSSKRSVVPLSEAGWEGYNTTADLGVVTSPAVRAKLESIPQEVKRRFLSIVRSVHLFLVTDRYNESLGKLLSHVAAPFCVFLFRQTISSVALKFLLNLSVADILHFSSLVVTKNLTTVGSMSSSMGFLLYLAMPPPFLRQAASTKHTHSRSFFNASDFATEDVQRFLQESDYDFLLYEEVNFRLDQFRSCLGNLFNDTLNILEDSLQSLVDQCTPEAYSSLPCMFGTQGKSSLSLLQQGRQSSETVHSFHVCCSTTGCGVRCIMEYAANNAYLFNQ